MNKSDIRKMTPDELDEFISVLLKDSEIKFNKPTQSSFKIKTLRSVSIMFYPSSLKVMISKKGKNKVHEFDDLDSAIKFCFMES